MLIELELELLAGAVAAAVEVVKMRLEDRELLRQLRYRHCAFERTLYSIKKTY